jgi:hypothetical protein
MKRAKSKISASRFRFGVREVPFSQGADRPSNTADPAIGPPIVLLASPQRLPIV